MIPEDDLEGTAAAAVEQQGGAGGGAAPVGAFVVDPQDEVGAQGGVGRDLPVAAALACTDDDQALAGGQVDVVQVQGNDFAQAQAGIEGEQGQDPVPAGQPAFDGAQPAGGVLGVHGAGAAAGQLERAGCRRVFSEKISTRVRIRPELENPLALASEIKQTAGDQAVILTVAEMKRLAHNAAELMTLAATLQQDGIQLELLTGPLTGIYDPTGMGSMLFAVLAVAAQLDRDYIRDKTLEGQAAAAARGRHGGRPAVIDPDSAIYARALREAGIPVPEIAKKLIIKTGKNTGRHPSVASVYRALAAASE